MAIDGRGKVAASFTAAHEEEASPSLVARVDGEGEVAGVVAAVAAMTVVAAVAVAAAAVSVAVVMGASPVEAIAVAPPK